MTVVTLIKVGEDYGVLCDQEGYIQGDHSLISAQAKYPQGAIHPTNILLAYANHRLYEIPGDFAKAGNMIAIHLADTKLYKHKDVLYNVVWLCKLKPDIGRQWYDQATPALV